MKLICFLSYGYPTIAQSIEIAEQYVQAGCDVLEIDLPSSDPYLEGEYIAARMKAALEQCSDYRQYMAGIAEIKRRSPTAEIILLCYDNTLREVGLEEFVQFCRANGLRSLIYVGAEDDQAKRELMAAGMEISCYVRYHLPEEEVRAALASNGFVYLQAKPTDGRINPQFPTLKDCINHLRERGVTREIYCGVGIHTPEDVLMAKEAGADGVFVGSAILKLQNDPAKLQEAIRCFKQMCL
jgi:tryptophan synthase alpha chain